jgi:hypothetical protein
MMLALFVYLIIAQQGGIERAAWLRGCWEARSPRALVEEQWSRPRAGTMLNWGRTTRGDTLRETEHVVLREHAGRLAYESHPSGQDSATFTSTLLSDTMVVFENAAHDYPQRVGYARRGADSLLAWIDGTIQGRTRRIEFPYQRVSCDR